MEATIAEWNKSVEKIIYIVFSNGRLLSNDIAP